MANLKEETRVDHLTESRSDEIAELKSKVSVVLNKFKYLILFLGLLFIVYIVWVFRSSNESDVEYWKERYENEKKFQQDKSRIDSAIYTLDARIKNIDDNVSAMRIEVVDLKSESQSIRKSLNENKIKYEAQIKRIQNASLQELDDWFSSYIADPQQ